MNKNNYIKLAKQSASKQISELKKINKVFSPILILHGRKDNIVPFEMGEALFKKANKPKYNYFIDNDDHMMDFNDDLINSINQFLLSLN